MNVVVLAGSRREANAYALDKGIRVHLATTSAQFKRADKIIVLPGFRQRRDRFALEQSAAARVKYGRNVELVEETDWTPPRRVVEEVIENETPAVADEHPFDLVDLADEDVQAELKARLKDVGLTLKKLPQKAAADAPTVDAPDGF